MKRLIILLAVLIVVAIGLYTFLPQTTSTADNLKKFSSYEELKNYIKSNTESYYGGGYYGGTFGTMTATAGVANIAQATKSESTGAAPLTDGGGAGEYSRTNIQVEGVDEADIVKNDGKYIYSVSNRKIIITDAYPAESAKIVSQIDVSNGTAQEIFINNNKLIVFGYEDYYYRSQPLVESGIISPSYYGPKTFIRIYDLTDKANPVLKRNITIDGSYYDSRMIGDYVYAIVNEPVYYGGYYSGASDIIPLPVMTSNGVSKTIQATDVYYFDYPDYSYQFTNIVGINSQNDAEDLTSKTFLLGYSQNLYVSESNIYSVYMKHVKPSDFYDKIIDEVIIPSVPADQQKKMNDVKNKNTSKYEKVQEIAKIFQDYIQSLNPEESAKVMNTTMQKMQKVQEAIAKEMEKTVIHKISVDKGKLEYKVGGEVPGYTLNQFSMDEYNNYFRIATTTQGWRSTGSVNNVYILDSNLKITGKLEDLAKGERIYSSRFIGNKGYLVTFRQVDPLFVVDLSDVNNPKVLGFLKIPGVSDYLHPYDANHIIGVGLDSSEQGVIKGMKLSLFDVSDVSNPTEVSKYIIGERGTTSQALYDHKAFLFNKDKNLLVIPVRLVEGGKYNAWQGAYVFNVDLSNGFTLKGKVSHAFDNTSTCSGSTCPTWVDGKFGKALSLNGNDQYVSIPDSTSLKLPRDYTISMWVKFNQIKSQNLIAKSQNYEYQYRLSMDYDGRIQFINNEEDNWKITSQSLEAGQWYHIAVVLDRTNDTVRIYINGVEDSKSPFTAEYPSRITTGSTSIGGYPQSYGINMDGAVDEIIIVNKTLSKDEISQLYQSSSDASAPSDTVLHLKFNEGSGSSISDSSGYSNSGTVTTTSSYSRYYNYYDYSKEITRSLYMDNVLYTLSNKMIKMNSLDDISEINRIDLPYTQNYYPYYGVE